MALRLSSSQRHHTTPFIFPPPSISTPLSLIRRLSSRHVSLRHRRTAAPKACVKLEEKNVPETGKSQWGKVSAVLFDMDGVLCNSEEPSRRAGVDVFHEMGVQVTTEDFVPFMGTGKKFESLCYLGANLIHHS